MSQKTHKTKRLDWFIMYELQEENKELRNKIQELNILNNNQQRKNKVIPDVPINAS